jgi:hexosaminidase
MPNYYVAADGLAARTIASTRPVVDPETGLESLPFVAPFTDEARLAGGSAADTTVWATAPQDLRRQRRRPPSSPSPPPPSCPRR